jgi:SAM-dependent methyltransferase
MSTPEFTGERFIPGKGGAQITYEHLHRYLFAARWARGKRVLDVATGAGYGAALLARCARLVYAMDIDEGAIRFARGAWSESNLTFFQADATRMPLRSASVGLAIAMEVLEHLEDQEGLVREIARVCSPEGIALISTPNKASYSDARGYSNPFHAHEFYRDDFLSLVGRYFPRVRLLFQQVRAGSLITSDATDADLHQIITSPMPDNCGPIVEPMYFLAICSHQELSEPLPDGSAYLDLTDNLLLEWEQRLQDSISEISRLNDEIHKLGNWGKDLEETIKQRDETLRQTIDRYDAELKMRDQTIVALQEHQEQMRQQIELRDQEIERRGQEIELRDRIIGERDEYIRRQQEEYERLRVEFDDRGRWARGLEERVADRDALLKQTSETLDKTDAELHRVADQLARIRHYLLYRILCRAGLLPR